ncbi:condensation domain-containing protein [Streptomyces sp. NBC_00859]|uniref:condensation domain-containing protein n=1 Tax=Streptomyces sp. NBC_00859 TaxID=2903682 RepID=UPI003865E473|nr:condensation domain-containing protein [Streptomyces sp. NBC_00859]
MSVAVPLSLGQLSVWQDIRDLPPTRWHEANNAALWALPHGVGTAEVRTAVRAVVARHPSLRTRYDIHDPGSPGQLAPDTEFSDALPVADADDRPPAGLVAGPAAEPFRLGSEHGWRATLLTRAGAPSHLLFVKHHIAADAWAQEVLRQEFTRALTDPSGLGPTVAPGPAELAAVQHAPAGLRRQSAALGHWERLLDRAPSAALPAPAGGTGSVLQATLRSGPAVTAARTVAAAAGVSVPSVVLAAYARSVARICGTDTLLVQLMSANRFTARWQNVVTSMNQWVPALIEGALRNDLRALAAAAHWSSLGAFRHGAHDVTAVAALRARRPDAPEPVCAFNYVAVPGQSDQPSPEAGEHAPVIETAITWEEPFTTIGPRCYARAVESPHEMSVRLTAKDVSREQCTALLRDMHDALLSTAGEC